MEGDTMYEFGRIKRLPPYVFSIVNDLKSEARRRGEDIIDLGMGNPDLPAPKHIIEKLCEAARNPRNHRYSASKGITQLRVAITEWYKRRYDVDVDPEREAVATIGSKEGLSHLLLAALQPGDVVMVPAPAYPIHPYGVVIAGAETISVPITVSSSPGPRPSACPSGRASISSPEWRRLSRRPGLRPRC
jgi:alanine-synthesizing transaminase